MSIVEFESKRLIHGAKLNRDEFLRLWQQLPDLKRAELIEGIVHMPSPVGWDHGQMCSQLDSWLSDYVLAAPLCRNASDVTWLMLDSAPQPDLSLRILPEFGGKSRIEKSLPAGAPELAVEVASSTVAYDLKEKLNLYCDAGVQEYLVVVLGTHEVRWHQRLQNRYQLLQPEAGEVFRSLVFPGLWLNAPALLRDDMKTVRATLQEGLHSPEHAEFVAKLQAKRAN